MGERIPEGWRECKLGEVAELVREKYTPRKGDELNYIGLEHIQEQALRLNGIGHSDDVKSDKSYFKKGDILFGKLRPYFRKVVCPNFDGVCSTDIWVIRSKEGMIQDYLFYLFASKELVDLSSSGESGTRMPRADWNFLRQTVWRIPKCESEQRAIASVLGSLDDKIDLLNRENKTLEQMAEVLFRQWFIEKADEGWEKKPLSFFGNIVCGKTPSKKKKEYFGGNIPFIKIPDMHGNTFIFETYDSLTKEGEKSQNNKTLPAKSICVSCIATVGLVSMTTNESQTNQQINSIIPRKDFYRYYLYLFMKNSRDLFIAMASGGTATLNLNKSNFSKIEVTLPNENILINFHIIVEPIFDKLFINTKQIRTLEKLRDTLLPKLMSGEVRVNNEQ